MAPTEGRVARPDGGGAAAAVPPPSFRLNKHINTTTQFDKAYHVQNFT